MSLSHRYLIPLLVFSWLLAPLTRAATDLATFDTADKLWAHIEQLQEGPKEQPQSEEEVRKVMTVFLAELEAANEKFRTKYPDDPRRWDAQMTLIQITGMRARLAGERPDTATIRPALEEIVKAPKASARAQAFAKSTLVMVYAQLNTDESLAALKKLSTDSDQRVARQAKAELDRLELRKKPLELSFTAVDGRKVDLATLRGKVVLIDFWATWCGPCRKDMPNVIAAYKQHHAKGFEIVGISLDDSKEELLAYVKEKSLSWPQYFDGKGWENDLSRRFGVTSIPAQWLVDKKGFLRATDIRGSLGPEVEKLLAE